MTGNSPTSNADPQAGEADPSPLAPPPPPNPTLTPTSPAAAAGDGEDEGGGKTRTAPRGTEGKPKRTAPLHLLIVVNVFEPDCAGGAALFTDLARALADRGIHVTVRCAYPYYPEWKDKSGDNGWHVERVTRDNLTIERYGLYIPRRPGSLMPRMLYELSFGLSLMRALFRGPGRCATEMGGNGVVAWATPAPDKRQGRTERDGVGDKSDMEAGRGRKARGGRGMGDEGFDAAMVFCPLMGSVAFGAMHRLIHRCPLWLNVQDMPADAAAGAGLSGSGMVNHLLQAVQRFFFNRADVWSSVSPVMVRRLQPLVRRDQPVHYLPNWLHAAQAAALGGLPCKLGRPVGDPVGLFYSGNIGGKQDLLELCQTLHATDARFLLRIQGGGGRAAEVRQWIQSVADERFVFGEMGDEAALAQRLHEADFVVIPEKHGCGSPFIPSKLIPAVAAGTPLLAVADAGGPFAVEVDTHRLGPRLEWDGLERLPDVLADARNDPATYRQWQQNALERAKFYDRRRVMDEYEAVLRGLVETSRAGGVVKPGDPPRDPRL